MMMHRVTRKHESVLDRPQGEDRRVGEQRRLEGPNRSQVRRGPGDGQALLQAARRARHLGAEEKAPGKRPKLDEKATGLLTEDLQERPWATHSQRAEFLLAVLLGVGVSEATVCRAVRDASTGAEKRSGAAAERDEFLRSLWRTELGRIDPERPVFVDEMGTHTSSLAPLYAYAPVVGGRAFFEAPRNRAKNTTLLTSLRGGGMGLLRRPWKGRPPPASSKPTRSACWIPRKIKAFIRKAEARSHEALIEAMGAAIWAVTARDARGFFEHCGYAKPVQPLRRML
jgi:transposase